MDRNVIEMSGSFKMMKKDKKYREGLLAKIVAAICALLNSFGGKLNLNCEEDPVLEEEDDRVLRMIEQRLLDIIGSCTFNSNLTMPQMSESNKQLVIKVDNTMSLCTVEYHLYLPTETQVIPIAPLEHPDKVKAILNREVPYQQQPRDTNDFVLNRKHAQSSESHSTQFKQLKSEKSKCVSLGDRMINKSNKLDHYISAFANKDGGQILYGIQDDGIVKGEEVGVKDQEEIEIKVSKAINKMIWCGGKLERGEHWDIEFVPVNDKNMDEIPSLFVIIISVVPLRGGLFIQEPESYHVVQGRVERMSFIEWKRRLFNDIKAMIPSLVSRGQWSSIHTQTICHNVFQQLVKYQNDGDLSSFETFAKSAIQNYPEIQVRLAILGEESACAYKKGQFKKAKHKVVKYEELLSSSGTKDYDVFTFRAAYAKSAISRAKGDYQESYDIAQQGLQLAEIVPAGILTAWFYNHVAIVEKILSQQKKLAKAERSLWVKSALAHFIKALQHTQASSIEQDFSIAIADLQQRIHTFRAITLLGDVANGANFREATPSDIEAAETDVTNFQHLVDHGYPVTSYRKTYYLFSLSDLRVCQWWQQQTKEKTGSSEIGTLQSSQGSISSNLLKEAFDYATKAKAISKKFHFEELKNYANKRVAVITEMMIKQNVSSLRLPNRRSK